MHLVHHMTGTINLQYRTFTDGIPRVR